MIDKELINNIAEGQSILIIGYGVTGQALAEFFDSKNIGYYIAEEREVLNCSGKYFLGHVLNNTEADIFVQYQIKGVFPSPGVALTHPLVQKAKKQNIPVIGELELAALYLKGDFIAVTGTNGKSTTVRLINALLKRAGINNSLKGNIGAPLISAVNEPPKSYYVVEESSFQLELIGSMRHHIAVCLNVTEDHFDRYQSFSEYAHAKAEILLNSTSDDYYIYNHDDRYCLNMGRESQARAIPYSLVNSFDEGGFVRGDDMVIRLQGVEYKFNIKNCSLKGMHNIENTLAALIAVLLVKNDSEAVMSYRQELKEFRGLEHRLEKIHSYKGVDYYDDSKATNVGAVVMALASFDDPIILIAGGKDKLCDFKPLKGLLQGKVKRLILMGEAKERMAEVLSGATETVLVENMHEAVRQAHACARANDVVLLSPACSSYDSYENYKQRGEDFKKQVKEICKNVE